MKVVELNRPALWKKIRSNEISLRKYAGAYPYVKNGINLYATPANPVYRYAKSYSRFSLDFALFIFSDEPDVSKIESFLDTLAKKLKKTDIAKTIVSASMSNFKYLDDLYGGTK